MPTTVDPLKFAGQAKVAIGAADDIARIGMQGARASGAHSVGHKASVSAKSKAITPVDQAAAVAAATALSQMDQETGPTAVDRTLDISGSTLGMIGMAPMIGGGALNLLGGGVKKAAGLFKSKGMENVGKAIQKPAMYVNETTFAELGKQTGIGKPVAAATQKVADVAASGVEKINKVTGFGDKMASRSLGKAESQFRKLSKHANGIKLSNVHADLRADIGVIHDAATRMPNIGTVDHHKFSKAVASAESTMEKLGSKATSAKELKSLKKLVGSAGKTAGKLEAVTNWSNPAAAIKAAPKGFGQTTLAHGAMNGAFIAGSGVEIISDARGLKQEIAGLKEMIFDQTGKQVSTATALFGSVPESAREMRSAILKTNVVKMGAATAGLLTNVRMALSKRYGMLSSMAAFMIPAGISQLVDASVQNNRPIYTAFRRNALAKKAAGQPLMVDDYAPFIVQLVPELRKMGAAGEEMARKVAEQYVAMQATPGQVMNEKDNGDLMGRVYTIRKQQTALMADGAAPETTQHTERLAGTKRDLPVLGHHTKQVVAATPPTLART